MGKIYRATPELSPVARGALNSSVTAGRMGASRLCGVSAASIASTLPIQLLVSRTLKEVEFLLDDGVIVEKCWFSRDAI